MTSQERLEQTLQISPTTGCVRFERRGDELHVVDAPSVIWFPRHVLECRGRPPEVGLSFDGVQVTLHAPNGRWIWKLTGRTRWEATVPGGLPTLLVEGRWPD